MTMLLSMHMEGMCNIPRDRAWFQVLVQLLGHCENVRTIDYPAAWGEVDFSPSEYSKGFLGIDRNDPEMALRRMEKGRMRIGKDYAVVEGGVVFPF